MEARKFRIGNLFDNGFGKIITVSGLTKDNVYFDTKGSGMGEGKPIPLTEDWLKRFGFKKIPHFTIGNSRWLDVGRNRRLSISDVNTPNLMLYLQQVDDDGKTINDLICLHNWDYDKQLYVHRLQNLFFALTGEELTLKTD